mmetsp:Transcript_518/g.1280  ORF Transcript_518/g.1280 Transcript_518/m.1280 type:complete len:255 (+) Transcript_518:77-841(+)
MGGSLASCLEGLLAPPRPTGKLTLKYFPISGRAEPIRLALHLGKFQHHDMRISGSEWVEKHKQNTPFGQLPVLELGGDSGVPRKAISQTKAILRYIGKMVKYEGHCLYPRAPLAAAKVDEVLDAFDDLWILLAPTYRIKDPNQKAQVRQQLFSPGGEAARMLDIFERMLAESPNGFVVPEAGFSVADLMYFCFLNSIRSGFIDGLGPELYNNCSNIMKHKEMVAQLPEIRAYYQTPEQSNPVGVPYYEVFKPGK